jgi:hypothetical protein
MAMAAREWAIRRGNPDPDGEMAAALLCDLGALIYREMEPEAYSRLLQQPIASLVHHQCELEEEIFGINHADVGAYLLHQWGLPDDITQAVRHPHRPSELQGQDSALIERIYDLYFASLIGQLQLAPNEPTLVSQLLKLAAERFKMDARQLEKFLQPLNQKIEEFAALLNVQIGTTQQYPALLAQATESSSNPVVEFMSTVRLVAERFLRCIFRDMRKLPLPRKSRSQRRPSRFARRGKKPCWSWRMITPSAP